MFETVVSLFVMSCLDALWKIISCCDFNRKLCYAMLTDNSGYKIVNHVNCFSRVCHNTHMSEKDDSLVCYKGGAHLSPRKKKKSFWDFLSKKVFNVADYNLGKCLLFSFGLKIRCATCFRVVLNNRSIELSDREKIFLFE